MRLEPWMWPIWAMVLFVYVTGGIGAAIGVWLMGRKNNQPIRALTAAVLIAGYPIIIPLAWFAKRANDRAVKAAADAER